MTPHPDSEDALELRTIELFQRNRQLITVVGSFANIQAGQTLQLQGVWGEHPQYGSPFQVVGYKETKPATLTGIEKYLGSALRSRWVCGDRNLR